MKAKLLGMSLETIIILAALAVFIVFVATNTDILGKSMSFMVNFFKTYG